MLPKDVNSSRRPRVAQNSSALNSQKRKSCSAQTAHLGFFEINTNITFDGKISKNDQDNYNKALEFVNNWNNAMNEYLKKKSSEKTREVGECSNLYESLKFAPLPNYMALFLAIKEVDNRYADTMKPQKKNSYTQTKNQQERIVVDVKSQTQYVRFAENITEERNDVQNIPNKIQQAQYATYPQKSIKNPRKIKNPNYFPPLEHSTRMSDSNIRQINANTPNVDLTCYNSKILSPNPIKSPQVSPLRQNQSFGSFNSTPSSANRRKRPLPGLLSPNGMIASEINANGTPIIVRDMFEKVQNPLGLFVSQGNILKNISRNGSSSSSVILSDKESEDLKISGSREKDDLERTSSPYVDQGPRCGRESFDARDASSGCEEEDTPIKHHPLNLNERDLNSKDRNFISSIGIFTEAGELKPNAKTYLERKEDVRRGPFRAPRLSQLHVTENYNIKSCDSGSLLSDLVSTRSSEFDE